MTDTELQERLTALELAVLDLSQTVDDLNAEVVRQAKRLEQAEATCRLLKEALNDGAVKPLSEEMRPPHY